MILFVIVLFVFWKEFSPQPAETKQNLGFQNFKPDSTGLKISDAETRNNPLNKTAPLSLSMPPTRLPATANPQENLLQWLRPYQSASGLQVRLGIDGQVTVVTGLKYPAHWKTGEDGLAFAQDFASQLGLPKEQITLAQGAPPETDVTDVFKFSQVADQYPVFNSFLQVTQAKSSGDIYLITNELKNLGTPDLSNNYSSSQIEDILREKYGQDIKISAERNDLQIFSSGQEKSELARAYTLNLLHPTRDRRYVLISTKDGKILFDQSLVTH